MTTTKDIVLVIKRMCQSICSLPENVCVKTVESRKIVIVRIDSDESDISKIIGKKGTNIQAISRVAQRMFDSLQKRSVVKVNTCDNGKKPSPEEVCLRRKPFVKNPEYKIGYEIETLKKIMEVIYDDCVEVEPDYIDGETSILSVNSRDLPGDCHAELEEDLNRLFSSIGKIKGHNIMVEFRSFE